MLFSFFENAKTNIGREKASSIIYHNKANQKKDKTPIIIFFIQYIVKYHVL